MSCVRYTILCLHDILSLSPKLSFFARSGPPFQIRSVLIGLGCPKLQMVDLSERENRLCGGGRGVRANTELGMEIESKRIDLQWIDLFDRRDSI